MSKLGRFALHRPFMLILEKVTNSSQHAYDTYIYSDTILFQSVARTLQKGGGRQNLFRSEGLGPKAPSRNFLKIVVFTVQV